MEKVKKITLFLRISKKCSNFVRFFVVRVYCARAGKRILNFKFLIFIGNYSSQTTRWSSY